MGLIFTCNIWLYVVVLAHMESIKNKNQFIVL